MLSFEKLRLNYPNETREKLYRSLGPDWVPLIDNPNYQNTCSIRLSVTINRSGYEIPKSLREAVTASGETIILKVSTMQKLVEQLYGDPWGMSKEAGTILDSSDIPSDTGIIAYHANWSDATGHFDLWHGTGFIGAGNLEDVATGYDVALWKVN